jgi:hypothetical protein
MVDHPFEVVDFSTEIDLAPLLPSFPELIAELGKLEPQLACRIMELRSDNEQRVIERDPAG